MQGRSGAYSINNNSLDVIFMLIFGFIGYLMRKFEFEPAPLVLAYVLGPMLEKSLRQSLILTRGDPYIFLHRPITLILLGITIFVVSFSYILKAAPKNGKTKSTINKIREAAADDL
ncbi:tripartite tricarboxylate transporter permease [Thermodesulfobacteriota bacterium]